MSHPPAEGPAVALTEGHHDTTPGAQDEHPQNGRMHSDLKGTRIVTEVTIPKFTFPSQSHNGRIVGWAAVPLHAPASMHRLNHHPGALVASTFAPLPSPFFTRFLLPCSLLTSPFSSRSCLNRSIPPSALDRSSLYGLGLSYRLYCF